MVICLWFKNRGNTSDWSETLTQATAHKLRRNISTNGPLDEPLSCLNFFFRLSVSNFHLVCH